jgi:type I restriction enzyme S subunit
MAKVEQVTIPEGYKQTEVGVIPEDWEVVELGDIAEFYKGKGLPKSELIDSGAYKCIHYGELFTHYSEKITEIKSLTDTSVNTFLSKSNDILMPTSDVTPNGLATASGLKEDGVILGGDVLVIRPKQGKLDSTYFAYIIRISKNQIMQLVSGSTVYHLYGSDMATFKYAGPKDIKEQTAIANALSDVDKLIAALETLIAKKSAIKTAAMQQLLTGKKRLPGFANLNEAQAETQSQQQQAASAAMAKTHPTQSTHQHSTPTTDTATNNNTQTAPRPGYKKTELGEVPEDWEVVELGDIAKINMGQSPSSSNYNKVGLGLPLVQGNADIRNRKTIIRNYTTEITKSADKGDLMLSVRAPVGEVATADFNCCIGRGVCSVKYPNEYLYHWLILFESQWEQFSKGSTFDSISSSELKAIQLILPSTNEEQTAIASVLSDMDAELDTLQQHLTKTQKIKQGMMQELLTGKTRLI